MASIMENEVSTLRGSGTPSRPKYVQIPLEHWLGLEEPKKRHRALLQELGLYATSVFGRTIIADRLIVRMLEPALRSHTFEGVWVTGIRRIEALEYLHGFANERGSAFVCVGISPSKGLSKKEHPVEQEAARLLERANVLLKYTGDPDEVTESWIPAVEEYINGIRKQHQSKTGRASVDKRQKG